MVLMFQISIPYIVYICYLSTLPCIRHIPVFSRTNLLYYAFLYKARLIMRKFYILGNGIRFSWMDNMSFKDEYY